MPLFSDLSSLSHYYSGGSTSLNYLSGPYAGHSSIVAANYRTPTSTYSKPSSRVFANRGYTPHLATISENQITRAGLSRMNSPKMMYHASPKYKIQKPISINTADIDVSSNRYRRNLERTPLPVSKPTQTAPKSPERSSSFKENKESSPKKDEDSESMFMPRIDKNFRSTIKRERTVVRFHTNRNLGTEADETPVKTEEEKCLETVKVFDEGVKLHKQKWRENFDPDELSPAKKRPQPQKPLSERLVEKFIIKEKLDEDVLNYEERRRQREENLLNYDGKCNIQRNSSRRKSVKKVPSFHDICRTISSESIDEDLNPGQPIPRRNTRKKSSYDVLKAIRRDSAEINQEEILLLDALIKEAHLDKEYEIDGKKDEQEPKTEELVDKVEESDTKRKKKFTKKKSNEILVDDVKDETKCTPQRRKIVKKKTSGSLDKAIEVITPKEIKINNTMEYDEAPVASPTRKTMPKITGTVEVEMKPNLKLVIDDIQVEETIMTSSSSPTAKKFKYNVIIEEIKSPNILDISEIDILSKLNSNTESKIENNKIETTKMKDLNQTKLEDKNKIQLRKESCGISKMEEDKIKNNKETTIINEKLDRVIDNKESQNITSLNKAELEKQKMLDRLLGKKKDTKLTVTEQKAEDEKVRMSDKKEDAKQTDFDQKAEAEKSKMLDKLLGKKEVAISIDSTKNAEEEKLKMLDTLTNKQEEAKLIEPSKNAEEEKNKMINKLLSKNEGQLLTQSDRKAEEEKAKMLDKLLGKKVEPKIADSTIRVEQEKPKMLDKLLDKKEEQKRIDSAKKAEEEKAKMLDKLLGKKEESKVTDSAIKAKEAKDKLDKKAEEEKAIMINKLLEKKEEPKLTDSTKKAKDETEKSDKKAEEEKAKMLDKLLGKKEVPKLTESIIKTEEDKPKILDKLPGKKDESKLTDAAIKTKEDKAKSDKKAEEEKSKMLDRLLGKKDELKLTDLAKIAEEEKAKSDKKAEEEKAKMLDKLIGKKEEPNLVDSFRKAEEEKAKAEEEKAKMLDKLLGKKENSKLRESLKKAEEEKAKMSNKLLGKKDSSQEDKLLDKKDLLEIDSAKKAEDEKNKMLDKLLSKKPVDVLKDTDKNKITEESRQKELNKNLQKDQPKSLVKKLDSTPKQLNEFDAKKSIPLSKLVPVTNKVDKTDRRKTVQKQENLDELDIDNFWDKMGKRETIYYKDRRKYLNDRREQELKNTCWNAEAVEEEGEDELESPKEEPKGAQTVGNIPKEPIQELPKSKCAQSKINTLKQEIIKVEDPQTTKLGAVSKIEEKIKPKEISKKIDNTQKPKPLSPKATVKDAPNIKFKIETKKDEVQKKLILEETATKLVPTAVLEEKIKPEVPIQEASKQLATKVQIEEKSNNKQEVAMVVTKEPIKPKLEAKPIEASLGINDTLKTSKDIQKQNLGTKAKEEILDVKEQASKTLKDNQKLKLGVKAKEVSLENKEQVITLLKEETKDTCAQKQQLSNKLKSDEDNTNIRPKVKRKSREEQLKKQFVHYTELQLEEMKSEIVEIKHEPIKPQLSFIIKDKFDSVLKPNKDIIIPTAEEFAKQQEENKDDENRLGDKKTIAPMQSNYLAPDPKPKPKPKWFDTCPVVIMATPRDLRNRGHRMQKPAPKVTYVSDSSSSAESDSSDEETSSSDTSGGSDVFETNVVFENNKNAANKWKSTSSNDSGFDSSAPGSPANNRNRIDGSSNASTSSSSDSPSVLAPANNPAFILEPMEASTAYTAYQRSGRVTPPATSIPRFRKYALEDFCFLKVLGKGSFGKVMLAELKNTEYYYAIKCLKKDIVLEDDDVECTLIERKVLALGTKHPYLCHLFCTFQTESHLFFVMEYLNGGDLMFHIQMSGRFPEPRARFYGAEIVSGLKFLHSKGIVYRDLKLDNILLDFDGHVRIADFGMCKLQIFLDRTADTFCGTPDYMAPEIIKGQHYNQGVDWWSFGVLLYEMLIGQSPFSGCDEDELFWSICNERPVIPAFLSREASQILTLLLEKDSAKRLGNKYCPAGDISDQSFFTQIDWGSLERRQLEAPFKPKVQHPLDTQYFDKAFTTEKAKLTPIEKDILHSMDQTQFHGFSYTNPNATDK